MKHLFVYSVLLLLGYSIVPFSLMAQETDLQSDAVFSVSPTSWTVPAEGGRQRITIKQADNRAWICKIDGKDWINGAALGRGDSEYTYTVKENTSTSARSGFLNFQDSEGNKAYVRITQLGKAIRVENVSIQRSLTLTVGGKEQLKPTITPADADNKDVF